MTTNWADTAISVTDFVGTAAAAVVKYGGPALQVAQFIGGFIPGVAPAIQVLSIATPIIAKIAAAAPIVEQALKDGKPAIDALQAASPSILGHVKELYALAVNADPARPETAMTAADVSNEQAFAFAGSIFEQSLFTPQDPRFARAGAGTQS